MDDNYVGVHNDENKQKCCRNMPAGFYLTVWIMTLIYTVLVTVEFIFFWGVSWIPWSKFMVLPGVDLTNNIDGTFNGTS